MSPLFMGSRRIGQLALALALLCAAACSAPLESSPDPMPAASVPPAPDFAGPYAEELLAAWNDPANPEFVRSALEDGQVSDQEWAQTQQRLGDCLAESDIEFLGFTPDGSYGADTGSLSSKLATAYLDNCEQRSGKRGLALLRAAMIENPTNAPTAQIMAECLVRLRVVAPGYTAADYLRDVPTRAFPYLNPKSGDADFWRCNANPSTAR